MPSRREGTSVHSKARDYIRAEEQAEPIYPEKRLWIAVVAATLIEYEDQLILIRKKWHDYKTPLHRSFHWTLRGINSEVRDQWFRHVCDMADVPHETVLRTLKRLDEKYRLHEIKFSDMGRIGPTKYQIKKTRRLKAL